VTRAFGGQVYHAGVRCSVPLILFGWGNGWNGISDRNVRENFAPVDGQDVLASLVKIPIET
jgi:hypothetical protein